MGDLDELLGKGIQTDDKEKGQSEDDNDPLYNLDFSDEASQNSFDKQEPAVVNTKKLSHLFGLGPDNQNDETEASLSVNPNLTNEASKEDPTLNVTETLEKLAQPQKSLSNFFSSDNVPIAANSANSAETKTTGMKSIVFNDTEDVIANLADKPKAPNSAQSKRSLMQDLFGKEPSVLTDASKTKSTLSSSPSVTRLNTAELYTGISNEITSKTSQSAGYSLSASKEPRRGRRSSTTIRNDPFGYLSASTLQFDEMTKAEEKQVSSTTAGLAPKSVDNENLPEWLGGRKASKGPNQEIDKAAAQSDLLPNAASSESTKTTFESNFSSALPNEHAKQSALTSKLLGIEFDQQAAIINMQQQEHELRTAAALSRQSEKLNYLLETQKMKLGEQEKQFNALIARQLERQTLIEAQMKAQQDRIDSYIQTLSAQPTAMPFATAPASVSNEGKHALHASHQLESESLLHKAQHEKLYLESTLESLKEKHDQEIAILEESYKKQISHLEEAMVQMEKRMQDDIEGLEADYRSKVQKLKEDLSDCERARRDEKATLVERNEQLIRNIQDRHHKSLEMLQQEHTEFIEKITKSKESERQAIEIMRTEGTNVQNVLNKSELIMENLENLQKKFENKDKNFSDLQENHFSAQEKNIEYLKKLLESQRAAFEEEKQKLMTTVEKLESNIFELTKEFRKQNGSLQISEENLKSKEQALLRDREIFTEQTNWERERLKAMVDTWTKEEDRQLEWLAQERHALAAERGKLQIFNRLKNHVDESSKIELEAAIKAAQDADFNANQEKMKWQEKNKELDRQKSMLEEEERRLIEKAKELQEFTQSAISKREEGLKALKEAHFIEQRYKEKFSQMHSQQEILIEKESRLAAEKLELAKARLSLHINEVERLEIDTDNNYQTSREKHETNDSDVPTSTECTTYFKDIVDPHLVILKWNLEKNLSLSQTTF